MRAKCFKCGRYGEWRYIGSGSDGKGRKWETYQCRQCGHQRVIAVS